jgi:hypothetical protein
MNRTKGLILGLALGVVVLMSYFDGGKDYFNRPIMEMLLGANGTV